MHLPETLREKVLSQARRGDVTERRLFLRWALLNTLALIFLIALGFTYGGQIHGPSLVAIPVILAITAFASGKAGKLCWETDSELRRSKKRIMHEARYLPFWAWVTPMVGIMCTVFGFWKLLAGGGTDADLHARIQSGGGVALVGTFVGVFASVLLTAIHRMIEHELDN